MMTMTRTRKNAMKNKDGEEDDSANYNDYDDDYHHDDWR